MIKLFKSNALIALIIMLVYGLILKASVFLSVEEIVHDDNGILWYVLMDLLSSFNLNTGFFPKILAIALVLLHAYMLNDIVKQHRLLGGMNYLVGALYLLITSFFFRNMLLSTPLIANTFLIIALGKLLDTFKKTNVFIQVFDIGFMVGLASLFYPKSITFLIFFFVAAQIYRSLNLREVLLMLSGFLVGGLLTGTIFFLIDQWPVFSSAQFHLPVKDMAMDKFDTIITIALAMIFCFSLGTSIIVQSRIFKTILKVRKSFIVIILMLLFAVIITILGIDKITYHFMFFAVPLSIVWAVFFMEMKKKRLAEIIHLVIIAFAVVLQLYQLNIL